MYPDVFVKFARARSSYGNVDVLPTPQFFYGLETGEEIAVEIEPGKVLVRQIPHRSAIRSRTEPERFSTN